MLKYQTEIELALPLQKVAAILGDPEQNEYWMKGLVNMRPVKGEPMQKGAQTYFEFELGRRNSEMLEEIIENQLPERLITSYRAKGVYNIVENRLKALDSDRTHYTVVHEFQFSGIYKLLGILMGKAFKKQSAKYLQDFKRYAEQSIRVND